VTLCDRNDWEDHARLYDNCFRFVSRKTLTAGNGRFEVKVVGSDRDSIRCVADPVQVTLLNGREKDVKVTVRLPQFVYADIKKGDKVGCAEFRYGGEVIAKSGIFAANDAEYVRAECKGFLEDLKSKLVGLFSG
jgi:D-alanyl-D-alanine carboxypeptidase/D-alanyl-D-alanine carboxypeptidase (penicillin-binding protein 5/6)